MGMQPVKETHTLLFPFTTLVFGKSFEYILTALFVYSKAHEEQSIEIKSLTGENDSGSIVDMSYLVEEESVFLPFILVNTLDNNSNWDKTKQWW
jgi:hypothetical protein